MGEEPKRAAAKRLSYGRTLSVGLAVSGVLHVAGGLALERAGIGLPAPREKLAGPLAVLVLPPAPPDAPPAVEIPLPARPVPLPPTPVLAPSVLEPPADPEEPVYVPHDVPPRLVNAEEVRSALSEGYPPELPAAASRSAVILWLFVDESGRVTRLRLRTSSGYDALDRLAQEIAPRMAFRPALHLGQRVGVWVAQQIRFQPRTDRGASGPGPVGADRLGAFEA